MAITVTNKDGKTITVAGAGRDGTPGKSAYQIAVDNGFQGTEQDWLDSLKCADGVGVPIGGTTGQVLAKKSDDNYDTGWVDKGIDEVDLASDNVVGVLPVEKVGLPPGGLEGQMLVKAGADSATPTKWGPWPSNPSLIINGDFRKPVNRNGKSEYTAAGYTIDRWQVFYSAGKVLLNEDCITISRSAGSMFFVQSLSEDLAKTIRAKTVTISILDKAEGLFSQTVNIPQTGSFDFSPIKIGKWNINLQGTETTANFRIYSASATETLDIYAVKLELGDQQTLAHQDADGNLVLNDPPNYDLQYLLCSQYSPSTGEFVGSQHSNPDLLDNARWDNKDYIINQRGQDEYTGAGYTIDRWRNDNNLLTITLQDNCILFQSGAENAKFRQIVPAERLQIGKTYTFSVLTGNIEGNLKFSIGNGPILPNSITSITFIASESTNNILYLWGNSTSAELYAAKLELGSVQTLAHKEGDNWVLNDPAPSPSLELLKCQRYFQVFETQSARPTKALDFRPTMRTEPTLSTITVDGKTLYTASADL